MSKSTQPVRKCLTKNAQKTRERDEGAVTAQQSPLLERLEAPSDWSNMSKATQTWYQESLFPQEVVSVRLEIGLRRDMPVEMSSIEVTNPLTNELLAKRLFFYKRQPSSEETHEHDLMLFLDEWRARVPVNQDVARRADLDPF